MMLQLTEERKKAIVENDKSYDDQFFYAVKTTNIFCRPSCKSRVPNFDNVTIFTQAEDALKAGYRPCKHCKSGGNSLPDEEWISHVEMYIKENYSNPLTLTSIAEHCHSSSYHLHRVFKKIKGITPLEYVQQLRIEKAEKYLVQTDLPIQEIGRLVGITNASRFSTVFKEKNSQTPSQFRKRRGNK
ncbi:bifunctional transcriptional activator/DNA repair enzyme AdaA [Gracilibacillus caseinilyticus]|uniref:Bifunctional transcriptional activator/DNA repair enzyme AdaA n=1 Tax=Gracilibacillus caseinilyticus TaxID=2932256 RepID=A0ABY4F2V4_9BACI|nr:bifunctional transcriptional activator/DNA repair enzyme AdaA [Gracilibacillus caseinilyticus]UOQ50566.1 bifunctional transcriptional activator/DNA repair enzyme AdaA [Gracilibacillus caseinilyticus]